MSNKLLKIFLFGCLLLPFLGWKNLEEKDILWGSKEITWVDFKAEPKLGSANEAQIWCSLSMEGQYSGGDLLVYEIRASMNTQKSWTKTSSDTILTHEKRHFDITEIYARKLRKAFKEKRFSQSTLNKESKALFNSINKELNKQQVLYDKETNHSINRQQQLNWESKIEKELNALSEYKSISVSTNIKLK